MQCESFGKDCAENGLPGMFHRALLQVLWSQNSKHAHHSPSQVSASSRNIGALPTTIAFFDFFVRSSSRRVFPDASIETGPFSQVYENAL